MMSNPNDSYVPEGADANPGFVTFKCALCGAVINYTPKVIDFNAGLRLALTGEDYPAEWEIPADYTIRHHPPDQYPPVQDPCIDIAYRSGVRRATWLSGTEPPATAGGTDPMRDDLANG